MNPWKKARTVPELGRLMARWLVGDIRTWPGYCATTTEPETRHLIPTLVAANRAGFVTTCSQPGMPLTRGYDGRMWRQRAMVDGWIADGRLLDCISSHANRAGVTVIANQPGQRSHPGVTVTEAGGEHQMQAGWIPGHRELIATEWRGVGSDALRDLRSAVHLTLVDPVWGRDDKLWPALRRAL